MIGGGSCGPAHVTQRAELAGASLHDSHTGSHADHSSDLGHGTVGWGVGLGPTAMAHGCAVSSPAVGPAQEAGQGRADAHPADPLFLDHERQELPLAVTGGTIQHRDRSGLAMKTQNPRVRIMYIMFNYDGLGTWSPCGLAHDCVNLPGRT